MTEDYERCPECGKETTHEEVDIGVGIMHGPTRCNNCGWNQETEINALMKKFGIVEEAHNGREDG